DYYCGSWDNSGNQWVF
nr:immunoglobulin light chain junction region [Macaca mulatta]MOX69480.1 immunoglobulin light chain junction region [Macaca mulatta]MOX71365.1 immunoglobulin light chain junction region [Macaca mulatta]MOX73144.1 immunoglobulin light chain junction region [Macaca mulatta]MOX73773.1 immunoglobulin light chain junction region [Macaca mulatta]